MIFETFFFSRRITILKQESMFPFKRKKKKNEDIFEEFTFFEVSWCICTSESPDSLKKESKMFFTRGEAEEFKNELELIFEKIGCDLLFSIEISLFAATAIKRGSKIVPDRSRVYTKFHHSDFGVITRSTHIIS